MVQLSDQSGPLNPQVRITHVKIRTVSASLLQCLPPSVRIVSASLLSPFSKETLVKPFFISVQACRLKPPSKLKVICLLLQVRKINCLAVWTTQPSVQACRLKPSEKVESYHPTHPIASGGHKIVIMRLKVINLEMENFCVKTL